MRAEPPLASTVDLRGIRVLVLATQFSDASESPPAHRREPEAEVASASHVERVLEHAGATLVAHPGDAPALVIIVLAPGTSVPAWPDANRSEPAPGVIVIGDAAQRATLLDDPEALSCDFMLQPVDTDTLLATVMFALRRRQSGAVRAAGQDASWFHHAPVGMLVTDPGDHDRVCAVNAAFERLTGHRASEVEGSADLVDRLFPDTVTRGLLRSRLAADQLSGEYEAEYRRRDGEPGTALINVTMLPTPTGPRRLYVLVDISRRKHTEATLQSSEDERRRLQAEMLQAQKMEGIGRLAAGIAHDFNNLLTVINGCSEILLQTLPGHDANHQLAHDIHKAGTRAGMLISQLLAFSRKQLMQVEWVNLNVLLQQFCTMLARMIGENIVLTLDCDAPRAQVRIDPIQFEQAIANLAINARDAMVDGGDLRIATCNVEILATQGPPRMGLAPGHYVLVTVADNGVGMPFDVQPHIFEPFFTTKEQGKGTGLGLATAYGIVKQSSGFIYFDSEPGNGTCFYIYLPARSSDEAHVLDQVPPPLDPVQSASAHVLLVEDDDAVRAFASHALQRKGYHVYQAATANAGLVLFEQEIARIGLVITDVVMPGMSGAELGKRVRALEPLVKVLYISGYTDDESLLGELADGSVEFLQKPFSATELLARARQLLES